MFWSFFHLSLFLFSHFHSAKLYLFLLAGLFLALFWNDHVCVYFVLLS